jgi:ribosomal protein S12 methylthiotransferase accessory factor
MPPSEVVRRLRGLMRQYGITRLGEITGLDTVGIPVTIAVRPNSRTLSVSQGKGFDAAAAFASAAMEATELAVVEVIPEDAQWASFREMANHQSQTESISHGSRVKPRFVDRSAPVPWADGYDFIAGHSLKVPWPLVGLDYRPHPEGFCDGFLVSSDGLASGMTYGEAIFHGLTELIERDAFALLQFLPDEKVVSRIIDLGSLSDPRIEFLRERIGKAGLGLVVIDMTTDIGVPAFTAVLLDDIRLRGSELAMNEVAAGCGCHLSQERAIIRAITEACQSRLTIKAGSRDDFPRAHYQRAAADFRRFIHQLSAANALDGKSSAASSIAASRSITVNISMLVARLRNAGIDRVIAVPIESKSEVRVVRMIVPRLEIQLSGKQSTIGPRGLRALFEATRS